MTNAPTYFGASAQSSGNFDIVFARVIKQLIVVCNFNNFN